MRFNRGLLLCFGVCLIAGACSTPRERLELPDGAREIDGAEPLVETLKTANIDLQSYKGIGRLTIESPGGHQKARIAWVGSTPGKLRVEVLAQPGGQPFASLASDGRWVYIVAHQNNRYVKKRATRSSLERLIAIPIGPQDVYAIMTGRVPILPYDTARLYVPPASAASDEAGPDASAAPLILTLKARASRSWDQKFYLVDGRVRKAEYFNPSGKLLYRTLMQEVTPVNGYRIPMKISLSDDNQASARIEVERCWTDVAVAPSVFQLNPPEPR